MAKQSARDAARKHDLLVLLTECEDRACAGDVRQVLRQARRRIEEAAPDAPRLAELLRCAGETRAALREERAATLRVCLAELEALVDTPPEAAGPEPGLPTRLLQRVFGRKAAPQEALMRAHEVEAERNVFALEKRVAALIDARAEKLIALRKLRADCDAAPGDGSEAGILRRQMRLLAPQIRDLDRQIAQHDRLLMSNERYRAQLEAGRAAFELRRFLPDAAEAETLLAAAEEGVRTLTEGQQAMDALVEQHEAAVRAEIGGLSGAADPEALREFDAAAERAAAIPEPAPAGAADGPRAEEDPGEAELA